jgi:hypothetical protein
MLGWCPSCELLKPIEPRAFRNPGTDDRSRRYYPLPHDVRVCVVRTDDNDSRVLIECHGIVEDGRCRKCGAVDPEFVERQCDGDRTEIV